MNSMRGCQAAVLWVLAGILAALAPSAAALTVSGYGEVGSLGEQGNFLYVEFTADGAVTLSKAEFDFTGRDVIYDADGFHMVPPVNNGVSWYSFFTVPAGADAKRFGFNASGFDPGDDLLLGMDLDKESMGSGTPFQSDYYGGTLTVTFSNGMILTTTFDTPGRNGFSAKANFSGTAPSATNTPTSTRTPTNTPTRTPTNTPTSISTSTATPTAAWYNVIHVSCLEKLAPTGEVRLALIPPVLDPTRCGSEEVERPYVVCEWLCEDCARIGCEQAVAMVVEELARCINSLPGDDWRASVIENQSLRIEGTRRFAKGIWATETGLEPNQYLLLSPSCPVANLCNKTEGDERLAPVSGLAFCIVGEPRPVPTPRCVCATAPLPRDSDGDGLPDLVEPVSPGVGQTNRYLWDSDGDGLSDGYEDFNASGSREPGELDARARDTDGDEVCDGIEVMILGTDPLDAGDPPVAIDMDTDGLPYGADPNDRDPDTDDDRIADGFEAACCGLDAVDDAGITPCLGDMNCDAYVTNLDALIIQAIQLGLVAHGDMPGETNCDTNRDGYGSNLDGLIIQAWFLNLAPLLPVPPQ